MRKVQYTEEEIKEIRDLFENKISLAKISEKLNLSKFSLRIIRDSDPNDKTLIFHKFIEDDYSEKLLNEIKELEFKGFGTKKISEKLNLKRDAIKRIIKNILKIDISKKQNRRFVYLRTEFKCIQCKNVKSIDNFRKSENKENGRVGYDTMCKVCEALKSKEYNKKRSKQLHKEKDPHFTIKKNISWAIWFALKKMGSSKNRKSSSKYLPFTIEDLKTHIESLFEPWMNWSNKGVYKKNTWDDNDQSTWKWQLDHITPQSLFPYTSMEDENFKKCWALSNLRPLSAKQNNIDGTNRLRHKI